MESTQIKVAGYENIYFDCPHCGIENVLNRASDLNYDYISGMEVTCQSDTCKRRVWINNDRVQMAQYHWFLQELPTLKQKKLYRDYALTLCQGAENFFLQAVLNKRLDRASEYRNHRGGMIIERYRTAFKEYQSQISRFTFDEMRTEFKNTFSEEITNATPRLAKLKEDRRKWAIGIISNSKINKLRNQVAHKYAYRPTLADIEKHDELVEAIYWLGIYLDVTDSSFARMRKLDV